MQPPFEITQTIDDLLKKIENQINQQAVQSISSHQKRQYQIQSLHSSLAIEQNSLILQQVTDIIDGKRVLGNLKDIHEVKNAYDAYEKISALQPYRINDFLEAHQLLTDGLVNESGQYRQKDVGIFDQYGNVVHMGARPQFIAPLMDELFDWGRQRHVHELIKSCVFHYEIETIHPFADGNGRMGRLWQKVILTNWNPLFAWLPIETMIYKNQSQYYRALADADKQNSSTPFIEFMLDMILETLKTSN